MKNIKCGILIPRYRDYVDPFENISMIHLKHFLNEFEVRVVKPESLQLSSNPYKVICFPDNYFVSIPAYSRLLLSPFFYESFIDFDYILIYQLDCLVFSHDLMRFCKLGYDYIGSPLFHRYEVKPIVSRVGNGGLSLRRVQGFLDVLHSPRHVSEKVPVLQDFCTASIPDLSEWPFYQRWIKKAQVLRAVRKGVDWYSSNFTVNEDLFWSDRARLFHPGFKIAPLDVALKFAFDRHPQTCFELNARQLPFGAHAWVRWGRSFWEPYLLNNPEKSDQ